MSFFVSPKNTTRAQNMTQTTQTIFETKNTTPNLKKNNNTKAQTNEAKSVSHEYDQKHEPPKKRLSVDLGIYYIYTVSIQL